MVRLEGIPISPGYASGVAVVYDFEIGKRIEAPSRDLLPDDVQAECDRLDTALQQSGSDLQILAATVSKQPHLSESVALLAAHATMTHEIAVLAKAHVGRELVNVEDALDAVICEWVARLHRLDNEYLRQREQDVRDVGRRMSRYLAGSLPWSKGPLPPGTIVVARELLPSEVVELAHCGVSGIITERGGRFGHAAILARSHGIPSVTRILHATSQIHPGDRLLVDGQTGVVTTRPATSDETCFGQLKQNYDRLADRELPEHPLHCATKDGTEICLLANLNIPNEVDAVADHGLTGVGLFRTEFMFLEAQSRPTIQQQLDVYSHVADKLEDQPLVIRTFDLGGDKIPPFLLLEDLNPGECHFLRGLRFSLAERDLMASQLRVLLKVAQRADVRILFPMVIGSDDFAQAIAEVDRIVDQFCFINTPPLGAMIETPAALFALDEILDLADFVAIGTNDLSQYMLATDRDSPSAVNDCSAMHPAVLRAIDQIVKAAARHQCPVCVCGEEASDPEFAVLLVGLGICELSVSPMRASAVRAAIGSVDINDAVEIATRALDCRRVAEVRDLLSTLHTSRPDCQMSIESDC